MLIKNSLVLIDETDGLICDDMDYEAVVRAGVSRSRFVARTARTTMLGMTPLFHNAFFVAMAVMIVFDLGFATISTFIALSVLYAVFFKGPDLQHGLPLTEVFLRRAWNPERMWRADRMQQGALVGVSE